MANNQYVNKVQFGNDTLIDLTSDTVAADKMLSGTTAHSASGASVTGTIPIKDYSDITQDSISYEGQFMFGIQVPKGYYSNNNMIYYPRIAMTVPLSGSHKFAVWIPNGTTTPANEDDWIPLEIEVDSEGNSNVTVDEWATGVMF